jgi:hypothetical protein
MRRETVRESRMQRLAKNNQHFTVSKSKMMDHIKLVMQVISRWSGEDRNEYYTAGKEPASVCQL